MNSKFYVSIILSLLLLAVTGCREEQETGWNISSVRFEKADEELAELSKILDQDPYDTDALIRTWSIYTRKGQNRTIVETATPYYNYAIQSGDKRLQVHAGVYLGQAYIQLEKPDSMKYYFNSVMGLAEEMNNEWAMGCIHNSIAIYTLYFEMNYNKVLTHFMEALKYAEKGKHSDNHSVILNNIAMTHYYRRDTTGVRAFREISKRGLDDPSDADVNPYLVFINIATSAYIHYMLGEYDEALKCCEITMPDAERYREDYALHTLLGNIYAAMGADGEAERTFRYVKDSIKAVDAKSITDFASSYGDFLMSKGNYNEAISVFEWGLAEAEKKHNFLFRYKLHLGLSEAFHKLGRMDEALYYHKLYHALSDSIFNIEREYSVNELRVKYETEKHENEAKEKALQLEHERRKLQVAILILLVILMGAGIIYILYERKNKLYRQLVLQHQEYLHKEKRLLAKLESEEAQKSLEPVVPLAEPAEPEPEGTESVGFLPEKKSKELYEELTRMMKVDHVYRENDISMDKLAEMLGTNRVYISRIINQYGGMTFNNYIHSFRIDEAVAVLSDPEDDTPLKVLSENLGYNSLTSFYRSFQKETGVPPSKYREEIRKIYRKKVS